MPTPTDSSTQAAGDLSASTLRPRFTDECDVQTMELERLVSTALSTAVEYLHHGGLLVPTLVTETDPADAAGPRVRLFGDPMSFETDIDAGLRRSRQVVDRLDSDIARYVWMFDGYAGSGSRHSDAIVMEAAERTARHGWRLTIRYRLTKTGIDLIDPTMVLVGALIVPHCGISV